MSFKVKWTKHFAICTRKFISLSHNAPARALAMYAHMLIFIRVSRMYAEWLLLFGRYNKIYIGERKKPTIHAKKTNRKKNIHTEHREVTKKNDIHSTSTTNMHKKRKKIRRRKSK